MGDESKYLTRAIEENATSAAEVSSAAGHMKSQDLLGQIEADRYLASKRAAHKGLSGLRIFRREGNSSG